MRRLKASARRWESPRQTTYAGCWISILISAEAKEEKSWTLNTQAETSAVQPLLNFPQGQSIMI
jgi:hypothetical protein